MDKKERNEEIQSRREFFKNAAKGALPILGAVILASNPIVAKATETTVSGCGMSCKGKCSGSCTGGCRICCEGTCKDTCSRECVHNCKGTCYWCAK